ncbi:hypothetical protein DSAG12_01198 [Promethearchaeum syntrophicum]|uniref:Uncharacterized protein n=1 Tax=Promethearchaeum syntrophicum TaxID=2594042 RepID=A0A5B9D8H8_9ARCH|nr:hypothetical protein [Candidatus Prometheoarchaeum syntrophicum]
MAKKKTATKKKISKKSTKKKSSKKTSSKKTSKKSSSPKAVSKKIKSKKTSKTTTSKSNTKSSVKKMNYSEIDKYIMEMLEFHPQLFTDEIKIQLDLTDSELNKAIKRLKSKKKIIKKSIMEGSKWNTALFKIDNYGLSPKPKKKAVLVWDTANDCPCFLCPVIYKCSSGQNYNNPRSCDYLSNWLEASVNDIPYVSPFHPNFELKKKKSKSSITKEKEKELEREKEKELKKEKEKALKVVN